MAEKQKIRVLVVDDSALMRKKIGQMINADEGCEVIGAAKNGEEAVRSVAALRPDVVTLDIELPKMDGMTALKYIMSEWPTPIIMVSGYTIYGGEQTIRCLEYGAVDLVPKPNGAISLDVETIREELVAKVKAAARVNPRILRPILLRRPPVHKRRGQAGATQKLVVIASSTGGPRALVAVLPKLPVDLRAALMVVQHMPEGFTRPMAERLDAESAIHVKEAKDGDPVRSGEALVARAGFQMTLGRGQGHGEVVKLSKGHGPRELCPAADVTMKSIAPTYGARSLGVVLTGMGDDGTEGLRAIQASGGSTVAEDQSTSLVYGMPRSAMKAGVARKILPLPAITDEIVRWANG